MNAYKIVDDFEQALSQHTGAPYVVTVESCSAALFLCCKHKNISKIKEVIIPKYTYPSVPASIVNAGGRVKFEDLS